MLLFPGIFLLGLFFLPLIYLNILFYTNKFNTNEKQLISNQLNISNIIIITCFLLISLIYFVYSQKIIYVGTTIELLITVGLIMIISQCYVIYVIYSHKKGT
jgi:hypothetical protein